MGGYRYVTELWKRKQTDAMKFLRRIRSWNMRQLPGVHRAPRPTRPDKAKMLGYKAMPGFVIYRIRVRRGGRRRPGRKGVVWGKPANHVCHLLYMMTKYTQCIKSLHCVFSIINYRVSIILNM